MGGGGGVVASGILDNAESFNWFEGKNREEL